MFLMPSDEIKTRLNIVDLISEYIQLKKAGVNFKASCPFHHEKTPSFIISPEKQIWHCFGCGEGGDIFKFIMKIEGLEFGEALRLLAKRAGITLKQEDPKITTKKTKLFDILETAVNFWQNKLLNSAEGKAALDYLQERSLTLETIKLFRLGFSLPKFDELNTFLIQQGFRQADILDSGLVYRAEDSGRYIDRFRGRIMFPICNAHGNVVGFTARTLPGADPKLAKYINTPQTAVYNKSQILYGLDKAKQFIRKADLAIIVEGNMDVISSYQAGVCNVVASSGTALTLEQIKLLKRFTNNLAMSFDADEAGQIAEDRGIETALSEGMNVEVIEMPCDENGNPLAKDPDECSRRNPELWQKAISSRKSIIDYYFGKTLKKLNPKDAKDKKKIAEILLGKINQLINTIEKAHWIKKMADIIETPERILWDALAKFEQKPRNLNRIIEIETLPRDRFRTLSEQILALALEFPENLKYIFAYLPEEALKSESLRNIYTHLKFFYNDNIDAKTALAPNFKEWLQKMDAASDIISLVDELPLRISKDYSEPGSQQAAEEIKKIVRDLRENFVKGQREEIMKEMRQAETAGDLKKIQELTERFKKL